LSENRSILDMIIATAKGQLTSARPFLAPWAALCERNRSKPGGVGDIDWPGAVTTGRPLAASTET
jgi:hypothetical protein